MVFESLPDGHNVREEQQEAEDLEVPAAGEVLESHHDQGHHHQSPKQDLSQTVHLQVKQTHLSGAAETEQHTSTPAIRRVRVHC